MTSASAYEHPNVPFENLITATKPVAKTLRSSTSCSSAIFDTINIAAYEAFYKDVFQDGPGFSTYRPLNLIIQNNGMLVVTLPGALGGQRVKIYVHFDGLKAQLAGNSWNWRGTPTLQNLDVVRMWL